MRLQEIMTTAVERVSSETPARDAWERMRTAAIHHLVVEQDGQVVGVVSDGDLGGRRGDSFRDGKTVGELMSDGVVSAKPATTLREAANLLRGHSLGCLPVVTGRKLVGIVTMSDVLDLVGRGLERPQSRLRRQYVLPSRKNRRPGIAGKAR